MSDIDLLPRADIPVLFNDFKCKADAVWSVVDSLVVTDVSQKEAMALARKTRLTLREIRIAVEHKRVELGEGHLKEIQKVNGAAKAIREFIEPLEARLLVQETYAERVEANRIVALSKLRFDEVEAIKPRAVWVPQALAEMPQKEYDDLVARLRSERSELEAANRLRVEAERKLAEAQAEAERQRKETAAILNAKLEAQRKEAEALAAQRTAEHKREREEYERKAEAARILAQQERDAANWKAQQEATARKEIEDKFAAEQQEAEEKYRREQAEKDRVRDEQLAVLEAELKAERAVKLAEEKRVMELAIAPDVEKLWEFAQSLRRIECPRLTTPCGISFSESLRDDLLTIAHDIEVTCKSWGLTTE